MMKEKVVTMARYNNIHQSNGFTISYTFVHCEVTGVTSTGFVYKFEIV